MFVCEPWLTSKKSASEKEDEKKMTKNKPPHSIEGRYRNLEWRNGCTVYTLFEKWVTFAKFTRRLFSVLLPRVSSFIRLHHFSVVFFLHFFRSYSFLGFLFLYSSTRNSKTSYISQCICQSVVPSFGWVVWVIVFLCGFSINNPAQIFDWPTSTLPLPAHMCLDINSQDMQKKKERDLGLVLRRSDASEGKSPSYKFPSFLTFFFAFSVSLSF